jgi:uncharacterized protein
VFLLKRANRKLIYFNKNYCKNYIKKRYICAMLTVSELYIYPIKSLGGIAKETVKVTNTGFKHDRRWMLVDENNMFLSQRTHPQMALLQPTETADGIVVTHKNNSTQSITIPFYNEGKTTIQVSVWDDVCEVVEVSTLCSQWFSDMLQINCKLVYMPDNTKRLVDKRYASNNEVTSFSDGYPILMIGQASLDELNAKLDEPIPMNRFRPNIVFTGGHAHVEDEMEKFVINDIKFSGVKPCSRCVMTTINQQNSEKGKEPLKTLATYRTKNNKIYFGQNILHQQNGSIAIGNSIEIKTKKEKFIA